MSLFKKIIGVLFGILASVSVVNAETSFSASVGKEIVYRGGQKYFVFFPKNIPAKTKSFSLFCPEIPDFEWSLERKNNEALLPWWADFASMNFFPQQRQCLLRAFDETHKKISESSGFSFSPKKISEKKEKIIPFSSGFELPVESLLFGKYFAGEIHAEPNVLNQHFWTRTHDGQSFSLYASFFDSFELASQNFYQRMTKTENSFDIWLFLRHEKTKFGEESFCSSYEPQISQGLAGFVSEINCVVRKKNVVFSVSEFFFFDSEFFFFDEVALTATLEKAFFKDSFPKVKFFTERLIAIEKGKKTASVPQKLSFRELKEKDILTFIKVAKASKTSCEKDKTCVAQKIKKFIGERDKKRQEYASQCEQEKAYSVNECILRKFELNNSW